MIKPINRFLKVCIIIVPLCIFQFPKSTTKIETLLHSHKLSYNNNNPINNKWYQQYLRIKSIHKRVMSNVSTYNVINQLRVHQWCRCATTVKRMIYSPILMDCRVITISITIIMASITAVPWTVLTIRLARLFVMSHLVRLHRVHCWTRKTFSMVGAKNSFYL
jgi:hypothetical protein